MEEVLRIDLLLYIVQYLIISVSNDDVTAFLKLLDIIDNKGSEECVPIL